MIIIKNANLVSMATINYVHKDIAINGSIIVEIGEKLEEKYPEATIVDAGGKMVTPGIVDPHCHVGMWEEAIGFEGSDVNEMTSPIYPELRAIDAIKPQDPAFKEALLSGVTSVATGPGSANVIGGTFTILKTHGKTVDDMVVVPESSMKMALGENPKRVYSAKGVAPSTRMATAALLRDALMKAKNYKAKWDKYNNDVKEKVDVVKPEYDSKMASLSRVFDGMKIKIHAHQQDDIATAIRIRNEFGLTMTIEHATEAHLIPDMILKNNIGLIIGPTLGSKSKYELRNKTFEAARILHENGIFFAIMTDHPVIHLANALTQVGLFVREGLPELEAFRGVTIYAAKINDIDHRVGSIEVGKDADIVIWDGHPLLYTTKPSHVFVNGELVHAV